MIRFTNCLVALLALRACGNGSRSYQWIHSLPLVGH